MTAQKILLTLLIVCAPTYGKDKIKIQIIESTMLAQKSTSGSVLRVLTSFQLKAILPDGSHSLLLCDGGDSKCFGMVPNLAPEKIDPNNEKCTVSDDGAATTCVTTGLGSFDAERSKDELTVWSRNGVHKYRIVSSW
jgi:hypothetical protein